jgi:hypothetical protein
MLTDAKASHQKRLEQLEAKLAVAEQAKQGRRAAETLRKLEEEAKHRAVLEKAFEVGPALKPYEVLPSMRTDKASAPADTRANSPQIDRISAVAIRTKPGQVHTLHRERGTTGLDRPEPRAAETMKSDSTNHGRTRSDAQGRAPSTPLRSEPESVQPRVCSSCGSAKCTAKGQLQIFECSTCGGAYHRKCLGLRAVPAAEWHCPACRIGMLIDVQHTRTARYHRGRITKQLLGRLVEVAFVDGRVELLDLEHRRWRPIANLASVEPSNELQSVSS